MQDRAAPKHRLISLLRHRLTAFWQGFSGSGLLLGTLLFAASLTPSLVPRPFGLQVALSGLALTAGYGLGVFLRWLWAYAELPVPRARLRRLFKGLLALVCLALAVTFVLQASDWQNSVRALMALPPVEGTRPLTLGLLAILIFVALLALGRLLLWSARQAVARLDRFLPRRIAVVLGTGATVLVVWTLINGLAVRGIFQTFDATFSQLDTLIEAEQSAPQNRLLAGSAASLIDWEGLGRQGRRFVSGTLTTDRLATFSGAGAMQPIRVYAGLNSAETIEERVELAMAELERTGAFERSVLTVITPTGTGWVDPGAIDSLEYLHHGDVASVAVQYSYLPSWLSLLAQPDYGEATARALFHAVYSHWRELPAETRPRLYLHGLSLGALNSERSADVWDLIGEPISGALWSGPPFRSRTWQTITRQRQPGSPAWLPEFRDGSVVRFANQFRDASRPDREWGPLRIVYLQYASDPIVFFEPESLYREPEWLRDPRGPDVSDDLRWYPVVTFLQLAGDIAAAEAAPVGYGHEYATEHYIDAWRAITDPPGWDDARIEALKRRIGDL